jgi:flagellin
MTQIINTNLPSLNAQRNMRATNDDLAQAVQRLSSGLRVNSARDDAAGLAIAERMNGQIKGMSVAMRNANDGISLAQVAEGALGTITDMLQRMRELAVQSANATNGAGDRGSLNTEYQQLIQEVNRTLQGTRFNGLAILGASAGSQVFQIGAGTTAQDTLTITSTNLATNAAVTTLGSGTIATVAGSTTALGSIDAVLDLVNGERATWGAIQNRFQAVIQNLSVGVENQTAARSRIVDADYAAETAALTRAQILQQAGTAMLAQANQIPQNVLSLLR